jgi:hypothetical protein
MPENSLDLYGLCSINNIKNGNGKLIFTNVYNEDVVSRDEHPYVNEANHHPAQTSQFSIL